MVNFFMESIQKREGLKSKYLITVKLWIHYELIDKHIDRMYPDLSQMNTDSFYITESAIEGVQWKEKDLLKISQNLQ